MRHRVPTSIMTRGQRETCSCSDLAIKATTANPFCSRSKRVLPIERGNAIRSFEDATLPSMTLGKEGRKTFPNHFVVVFLASHSSHSIMFLSMQLHIHTYVMIFLLWMLWLLIFPEIHNQQFSSRTGEGKSINSEAEGEMKWRTNNKYNIRRCEGSLLSHFNKR